jgi:transposase
MEYFAGLDVSMEETHVCVVTRQGAVVHEMTVPSAPASIAAALARVPASQRVLFETGRMAPMLFHGLRQRGLPVVCVESRQAYQALKLLATHKTDRNDARGLAHLARHWLLQACSCEIAGSARHPVADQLIFLSHDGG